MKEFYKSKTFRFGMLWVLVGIAGLFGYADYVPDSDVEQIAEIVNGIIIVVLRFLTSQKVALKL